MKTKNKNLITLEEFKEKNYGLPGSKNRDELESGYENFKIVAYRLTHLPQSQSAKRICAK